MRQWAGGFMRRDSNMANIRAAGNVAIPQPHVSGVPLPPAHVGQREDGPRKFSIVFPTRERTQLVSNLLASIQKNTANLSDIEVLVVTDNDDKTNYEVFGQYPWLTQYRTARSSNFSRDYYNFLANRSKGQFIITANDDCQFETPNWDIIAFDALKDKTNVVYGCAEDGLDGFKARGGGKYACFPILGRGWLDALGFVFPARIPCWGADMWCRNIADQCRIAVDVPIKIMHYCHHNRTREQDGISKRIAQNQVAYNVQPAREETDKLLEALKKQGVVI